MALPPFGTLQIPPFPVGSASLLQGGLLRPPVKPTGGSAAASLSETSPAGAPPETKQQIEQVSREFESLLLSVVFKTMRQTVPKSDFLGKTRDSDWYSDLFDMELARNFTHGRGIGLSTHIQQHLQLTPSQGTTQLRLTQQGQPQHQGSATKNDLAPSSDRHSQIAAAPPMNANGEIAMPVVGRLTSPYGGRADPITGEEKFHHGIDIASPAGTAIRAALPGTVTFSGWKQGYGLTVVISHADGYTTQYSHNSENLVQVGERISCEQTIALIGQSGRATGPHVHFEVKKDGQSMDPTPLLAKKDAV